MRRLLIFLLLCGSSLHAQQTDMDAELKGFSTIERSGKLVSIRLKPHAKGLELYLMGKDAKQLKSLKDWNIEAAEYEGETMINPFTIEKFDDRFVIVRPKAAKKPIRLKIQTPSETEIFNLDLTPK